MRHTILTVPGYHGSGAGHWQTWLEGELPDARRVGGIDWEDPLLARWAERWGSRLIDVGDAGHINTDSGHGPWPQALELLAQLRAAADTPLGAIASRKESRRGRTGALARLRHQTRRLINGEARP